MATPTEIKDRFFSMKERATDSVAVRIKSLLAEQWGPLAEAGWAEDDIRAILDQALEQCNGQP